MMDNVWITDYIIGGIRYWKCGKCNNIVLYSQNNMNYCGHCGERKFYTITEKWLAEQRRKGYGL